MSLYLFFFAILSNSKSNINRKLCFNISGAVGKSENKTSLDEIDKLNIYNDEMAWMCVCVCVCMYV